MPLGLCVWILFFSPPPLSSDSSIHFVEVHFYQLKRRAPKRRIHRNSNGMVMISCQAKGIKLKLVSIIVCSLATHIEKWRAKFVVLCCVVLCCGACLSSSVICLQFIDIFLWWSGECHSIANCQLPPSASSTNV